MKELTQELLRLYNTDIIRFLEDQYVLPETGKCIVFEDWQKDLILRPLFYDLNPDGTGKYTLALIGMPKKNGKSTLAAGVGLWRLFAGDKYGEIVIAANDLDQASMVIYNKIKNAIRLNPTLASSARVYKDRIEMRSTGTTCRPIAHQYETAAGLNPSLVLFDELWGFPSREFYDELTTSPARRNPLNLIVTYAGYDTDSLLYELYERGLKGEDPEMFFAWLHENRASWVTEKYLKTQEARMPPNVYARFHKNEWAAAGAEFVTQADIDMLHSVPWTLQLGYDAERRFNYVVACDLGLSHDRTARVVGHFDPGNGRVYLDNLRLWEGTPKAHVSIAEVEKDLVDCLDRFRASTLVVDPWQMEATIQKLKGAYDVIPFNFQTDMTYMSQLLIQMLRSGRLISYAEPELDNELRRLISKQTAKGWKIEHVRGKRHDCVVSTGMMLMETIRSAYGSAKLPDESAFRQRPHAFEGIRGKEF